MKTIALSNVLSNVRFVANNFMMETLNLGQLIEVSEDFAQVLLSYIELTFVQYGVEFNRDNVKDEIRNLAYLYLNEPEYRDFFDGVYKKVLIEKLKAECL